MYSHSQMVRVSSTVILPALLFALSAIPSPACSCVSAKPFSEKPPNPADRTFAVFTAEVIRFDSALQRPLASAERDRGGTDNRASRSPASSYPDLSRRVLLRVMESFSGPDAIPNEVWTHEQSSACGFEFVVGKKYLIETQFFPPNQPRWVVTKCSRTAELGTGTADESVRVLQFWKSGMRPPI